MGVPSHVTSKIAISAAKCSFGLGTDIIRDEGSAQQNENNKDKSQVSVRSHPQDFTTF